MTNGQEQTYVDISSFSYKTHFRLTIQRYGCIYLFMKWQVIFYRNISGQCPTEKFINGLPYDDAEEIVAAIAALRELGNKARRPLADYLEDGIYELRARRLQRRFRVLYTFVGKETIMDDLDRIISKKEREKPGFAAAVERRKGEILIAARLRKAREN